MWEPRVAAGQWCTGHAQCTGDLHGASRFTAENHPGTKVRFRNSTTKPQGAHAAKEVSDFTAARKLPNKKKC